MFSAVLAVCGAAPAGDVHRIKLTAVYDGPAQPIGLSLKASINDGTALQFLLDSGASDVSLSKHAAAKLHGKSESMDLVGMGAKARMAKRLPSTTVRVGDLTFRDCPTLALEGPLAGDLDGVMPLALFADYLVRLNASARVLEAMPYPESAAAGAIPVRADHRLLFLNSLNGYVLLDTGASFNAVAPGAVGSPSNYRLQARTLSLLGSAGQIDGLLLPRGVEFRVESRVIAADPAVMVDLSELTRRHQFEIAGILGYPALRRSVLTVNYRDAHIRLDTE